MRVIAVSDRETWDQAVLRLASPHILQSWLWGAFKAEHGWRATRLLFERGGQAVAAASVLERRLPRLPLGILYVPKGPALDWTNTALAAEVLAELARLARRRRAVFVKIDPDVYYGSSSFTTKDTKDKKDSGEEEGCLETILGRPACAGQVAAVLGRLGWRVSAEQIQFRNTLLLDLTRPENELLAAMKQKTRYNVRLAQRRGVTVRRGSAADLELFYRLYAETARRDGFIIRAPEYYADAWAWFMVEGQAHMLLAEVEGEAVAGLILFTFGGAAWYMYGASSERHRELMPNYLLQWEAMRLARSLGCTLYDLWGAPENLDEADPMWGVVRFKLGLGGTLARGLGAWDYAPNRLLYWVYSTAMPRYLGWLRIRGQQAF